MSESHAGKSELSPERRAELTRVHDAMLRAAEMARQIAIDTNTGIVIVRDRKVVHVSAAELWAEREREGR